MISWFAAASLAPAAALVAQTAPADQPARYAERVVVSANAGPVPFGVLTRDTDVITAEEIARLPVDSVAGLLRYLGGLDVRSRGPYGAQSDFSIRGGNFAQVAVLVNGVRINDAQTGHHNSDIPIPLSAIDRIEVVRGPGSSLHGADALAGAINIITRREPGRVAGQIAAGSDGLVAVEAAAGGSRGGLREVVALSALRTSGFMFDRDVSSLAASSQSRLGEHSALLLAHVRKAFGANGFYGPSPSKEWTDQTLVSFERSLAAGPGWSAAAVATYRTHGDRFLWDVRQPSGFTSRHRTHAATALVKAGRAVATGTRVTVGGEAGADWIRSSTLGDDGLVRGSVFAEIQQQAGARVHLDPAVRVDAYSTFGPTVNPSVGAAVTLTPALKLRGSAGRAFRVPTYTERFYRDPVHSANPDLRPERTWSAEAGADWATSSGWLVSATAFRRWEWDGIDWVRTTPRDTWRTANIQRIGTGGVDVGARRAVGPLGSLRIDYAYLDVAPGPLDVLSLYTLDYARHLATFSAVVPFEAGFACATRIGYGRRADAAGYLVWDARVDRSFGRFTASIEASNLLGARYQEVRGVDMPGREIRASIRLPW